jgi:hypothetical protein
MTRRTCRDTLVSPLERTRRIFASCFVLFPPRVRLSTDSEREAALASDATASPGSPLALADTSNSNLAFGAEPSDSAESHK